jgi:hypothetical protein
MRGFILTFALAQLLVGGAAAQDAKATVGETKSFSRTMIASDGSYAIVQPKLERADARPVLNQGLMGSPSTGEQKTCWFIRSYIFEREDGLAPVLKGETTCTPSNQNVLRRARKGGARLAPLTW